MLRYEPQHPGALDGLARLLEATGEWGPAAEALRQLIAALPEDAGRSAERRSGYRRASGWASCSRIGWATSAGAEEQLVLALASPGGEAHVPSLLELADDLPRAPATG